MKITDTCGDPTRLAQAILPDGQAVGLLAERLRWAIGTGQIPLQRVTVPSIQHDIDGNAHPATRHERHPTLGHAAIWAAKNGYAIRPELAAIVAPSAYPAPPTLPETENMKLQRMAFDKFYANADPDDPTSYPTNADVSKWLKDQGLSNRLAESNATNIRPKEAPKGRPQKKS